MKYNDDDSVMSLEQWVDKTTQFIAAERWFNMVEARKHFCDDFGNAVDLDSFYAGWLAAKELDK